jgi:molybdenum cofactor cytidylyltransferase
MRPDALFGAVILAGGQSSRMGTGKPLLRLGGSTVLERVAASIKAAEVGDIVVVTGHDPEELAHEAERLNLRWVHNDKHEMGMFSSVQAGVRGLSAEVQAFFVLPVDYPLIGPKVLSSVLAAYISGPAPVVHPCCSGRRGHPPLLSGGLRPPLESMSEDRSLKDLLDGQTALDVEVEDLSIHLDMDTPEDYRRLNLIAELLDGGGDRALEARFTSDDILQMLGAFQVPPRVVAHSLVVAAVTDVLIDALNQAGCRLDKTLAHSAALLHDVAKRSRQHADTGRRLLHGIGLRAVGDIAGCHMDLPASELSTPTPTEAQVLYLADKVVLDEKIVTLSDRADRTLGRYRDDAAAVETIRRRMGAAETIARNIEKILNCPLDVAVRPAGAKAD